MTHAFSDHFSRVASAYATYRPQYPAELFAYLASLAPERDLAWDCAAGTGQATLGLAQHFDRVIGTDASSAQIASAEPHPRVDYRVALAESSGLADRSINLVTVAQAAHWFDFDRFHREVRRVLVPDGVVALWSYGIHAVDGGPIDAIVGHFYTNVVGPFWPPERRLIEEGYRTIPFPFDEIDTPEFELVARWTLPELLGYLRTWSATTRYLETHGVDPVVALEQELGPSWGPADQARRVRWPLALRAGRA